MAIFDLTSQRLSRFSLPFSVHSPRTSRQIKMHSKAASKPTHGTGSYSTSRIIPEVIPFRIISITRPRQNQLIWDGVVPCFTSSGIVAEPETLKCSPIRSLLGRGKTYFERSFGRRPREYHEGSTVLSLLKTGCCNISTDSSDGLLLSVVSFG